MARRKFPEVTSISQTAATLNSRSDRALDLQLNIRVVFVGGVNLDESCECVGEEFEEGFEFVDVSHDADSAEVEFVDAA